jgi:hypothetical protein
MTIVVHSIDTRLAEASIVRDRPDNVTIGEWRPSSQPGISGNFLELVDFAPGKKLAVKIFLDQAGEKVSVTFFMETPVKSELQFKKDVQDNKYLDLSPKPKMIIMELSVIPSSPISRYYVIVNDSIGSVAFELENPIATTNWLGRLGNTISQRAKQLIEIPNSIASEIFRKERQFPNKSGSQTLVIADLQSRILKSKRLSETGKICSPLWLPNNKILYVEHINQTTILKIIPATLDEKPQLFGNIVVAGVEPRLTPNKQTIIFRQDAHIMATDLSGTMFTPLIQNKEVEHVLDVIADTDSRSCNIIFAAQKSNVSAINDLWMAKVQERAVVTVAIIPYTSRWFLLDRIKISGNRLLYESHDVTHDEQRVWQIYLNDSIEKEGRRLTHDTYNNREPSWSPDGSQIVFVSDRR